MVRLAATAVAALLPVGSALHGAIFPGLGTWAPSESSRANDLSDDGRTVVGESGARPFRWTAAGGLKPLGFSVEGAAIAVSADGTVILGRGGNGPFLWTAAGVQSPQVLLGANGSDLSADGSTVVGTIGPTFS